MRATIRSSASIRKIAQFVVALSLLGSPAFTLRAQSWNATLTTAPPGAFPPLRPVHAIYRFGWSGFTAATADVHFTRNGGQSMLAGKVQTVDSVRALWPFEADYAAKADATTLRPVEVKQTETTRRKNETIELSFDPAGVTSRRVETKHGKSETSNKRFDLAPLFDLQSALLYLRSQPLAPGSSYRVVVFPGKDPYLATINVIGRERINVAAGSYSAIRMELQLNKVGKQMELKPHKKFRKAIVWMSDDADRMLLRIEAEVFIGTVFAELQSAQFENAQPAVKRD
jgi:hypothetical protein